MESPSALMKISWRQYGALFPAPWFCLTHLCPHFVNAAFWWQQLGNKPWNQAIQDIKACSPFIKIVWGQFQLYLPIHIMIHSARLYQLLLEHLHITKAMLWAQVHPRPRPFLVNCIHFWWCMCISALRSRWTSHCRSHQSTPERPLCHTDVHPTALHTDYYHTVVWHHSPTHRLVSHYGARHSPTYRLLSHGSLYHSPQCNKTRGHKTFQSTAL